MLGEDPEREGLRDTPQRVMRAWDFWTSGYDQDPAHILKAFSDGAEKADEMVFQGSIPVYSQCEHHLAPFFGVAHIGYLPSGKIVGLSKLARLVECFARRLQVQERLTTQIADAMMKHLEPRGVGVVLRCRHMCIESRGIQRPGTVTHTSALLGEFRDDARLRAEFLQFVSMADAQTHP
jgi:GTP cyclohydrolase I